jgi:hypothetical protein
MSLYLPRLFEPFVFQFFSLPPQMCATPILLLLQIIPHALPVLSIVVCLDRKAKTAIKKHRVDCKRETCFDVRVMRGTKRWKEG